MTGERWWWLAFAAIGLAIGLAVATGPSNLTTAAALVATAITILAAILDEPPRNDRRPW